MADDVRRSQCSRSASTWTSTLDMLPDDYVLVAIDTAAIVAETIHEPPDDPPAIGDAWIESRRFALLRVPS
jgi:hypothetical protein